MNEVINLRDMEGRLVVGSREVAKNFNKEHYNLVRDIENLIKKQPLTFDGLDYFIKTTFEHKGNEYKEYLLTRDGLSLLVMGYTGDKSLNWKLKYIDVFRKLEEMILEKQPLKVEASSDKLLIEANETIKELQENMIVTYEKAKEIRKLASDRVSVLLKSSYVARTKLQWHLWNDYRVRFNITSYHNTLAKDSEDAKNFIQNWNISTR